MPHALVVEDDYNSAEMLTELIGTLGSFSTAIARTLKDARQQLLLREPDIVLLDLMLPDGSGMDLFTDFEMFANTEVVLITGHASLDTSIQALRLGAADYLIKPINVKQLQGILSRIMPPSSLKAELTNLREQVQIEGRFGQLWGRSKPMIQIYEQIARVAGTAVTVLVAGESGTGKEVVAKTIHELSRRRKQPFLAVNCGAISPQLMESEIFGHEKGSFTGAARQHRGYFENAHGGTLFLDEITEMPLDLQVKLLRVLETGNFMRVGSDQVIETDVRIVAATNRDPQQAVRMGKLREDLFYRLNVFQLQLPPLRDRLEDVELLAKAFLYDFESQDGGVRRQLSRDALERLRRHRWPGNVRELRNVIQRAVIMAESNTIDENALLFDASATATSAGPQLTVRVGISIAEMERRLILSTLEYCRGHKERTADILGVSLKTLYNRLREYNGDEVSGVQLDH